MRRWLAPALTTGLVIVLAGAAFAQGGGFFRRGPIDVPIDKAPPYDGRFTFARLKYTTGPGGYYFRGGLPAWAHGYLSAIQGHRSESSLTKILEASGLEFKVVPKKRPSRQPHQRTTRLPLG